MRIRHCVLSVLLGSVLLGVAGCNRVAGDWKAAQAADTSESYQQFLQQHQDSEFATKAQARMLQLAEDREWQAASGQDTKEAYEQFLAQHADSKWSQEARARLDNFQQAAATASTAADAAPGASAPAVATASAPAAPAVAESQATPPAQPANRTPVERAAPATAATAAKPVAKPIRVASIAGMQYAQLGAYSSRARAEQEWKALHARLGAELGSLQPHYSTGKSGSQQVYRLQVGLATPEQVMELCGKLKKHSQACIPAHG